MSSSKSTHSTHRLREASSRKYLPLLLSVIVLALDQGTKLLVVRFIEPYHLQGYSLELLGNFLRFIHVTNNAIAFSIGSSLSLGWQRILFIILPTLVLGTVCIYYVLVPLSRLQRWLVAGLIGGGLGNLVDRIFRSGGVVDFIDVKFYGFLGFERWPTFNIADSSIVVCAIGLIISVFIQGGATGES